MTPTDTFTRALKWADQLDHAANLGIADAYRARRCADKTAQAASVLTKEREDADHRRAVLPICRNWYRFMSE